MRRPGGLVGLCAVACALAAIVPTSAQAETQQFTLKSKPFLLSGFKTIFPKVGVPTPKRSGYITSMDAWLIDDRGKRVSIRKVMLHHIVFINTGYKGGPPKKTTCKGRGGEPFWGTGEEKQPLILPAGYGYQVSERDQWSMQAMLMSHDLQAHTVRVVFKVRVVTGEQLKRVKPLWLRANGCTDHPSYDIEGDMPLGGVHNRSYEWRMPLSGRIVAASAHLHGSSYGMTINQPRCGDRQLIEQKGLYGFQDDLVYRARPVLHEPGPIATGNFQSETGIPIRKGEFLRVTGRYDGTRPHPRVMAISHVYVAVDGNAPRGCGPLPADAHIFWTRKDGTFDAPVMTLPINGLGADGKVHAIERPAGVERVVDSTATRVDLEGERFVPANLSVGAGTKVIWSFDDPITHNVTLASGPRLVASANSGKGTRFVETLATPGTYKLFCYLHPITMTQVITVRP
jgi:plastocyanin